MSNLLSHNPIYFPKIQNKEAIESGIEYELALMDAHICSNNAKVFEEVISTFPKVLIDPCTYYLQFKKQRDKASFKDLPYGKVDQINRLFADPTYRLENLVKPVLKYQVEKNASAIIAPYFCSEDLQSAVFNMNLTLLAESIQNKNAQYASMNILAPICIGNVSLSESSAINAIVDYYTDDTISTNISEYYLMFAGFNSEKANIQELIGAAQIVYQLAQRKPVIIKQMGAFGLILNAIGNAHFFSYPAQGENFSLDLLDSDQSAYGRNHKEWMYITELFDYVNNLELSEERLNYSCDCKGCNGEFSSQSKSKQRKIHFLYQRKKEVEALKSYEQREKIIYLISVLEAGIKYGNYALGKGWKVEVGHLHNWLEVLKKAHSWNYEEDEKELEKFLEELNND